MARRRGRKGDHLATDDYTGFTRFASDLSRDWWGSYAKKPLIRNLQEIASPLKDPTPVSIYRGPNYEISNGREDDVPLHVGNTTVGTSVLNAAIQTPGLYANVANGKIILGVGSMAVGTTFVIT
jgi:hypothetical protein